MAKSINASLRAFVASWGSSVTSRLRAAKIYADAANSQNTDAKAKFWALPEFQNWTQQQWRLLYCIGSGILSPKYLDVHNLAVPLTLVNHNVRLEMQDHIVTNGLRLARINGTIRELPYKLIQQKHISQCFKDNGEERTVEEQVQWLKDHEKQNAEVLANGNIRIRHACVFTLDALLDLLRSAINILGSTAVKAIMAIIPPTELFNFLSSEDSPLGPEALMAIVTRQTRRNNA